MADSTLINLEAITSVDATDVLYVVHDPGGTPSEGKVEVSLLHADLVPVSREVATSTGLTGGGDLTTNKVIMLTGQAAALHAVSVNGFITRTEADTVAARTLTAGVNIVITNGDGIGGNPVIAAVGTDDSIVTLNSTREASGSDNGKLLISDNTARTLTLPNTLDVGFQITVVRGGATENVTVAKGSGVTFYPTDSNLASTAQWDSINITCIATGEFIVERVPAGGAGGDVEEAPADGEAYVRTNSTWADGTTYFAEVSHNHSAAHITSGTLAVARGGTNIGSYTTNNYIRAAGATTLEQRTPAQVLADIGGAAAGAVGSSGLTMATDRLLGRDTASTGAIEEIIIGSGLSLTSGTLTASVSGAAGAVPGPLTTAGIWISPPAAAVISAVIVADRLYLEPFPMEAAATLSEMALRVTTGVSGSVDMGIYTLSGDTFTLQEQVSGAQSTLSGAIVADALQSGFAATAGNVIWLAALFSSAPTVLCWNHSAHQGGGFQRWVGADDPLTTTAAQSGGGVSSLYVARAFGDGLPATTTLSGMTRGATSPGCPWIAARVTT